MSAIVAMSLKLDTLIGMFSIGEIPTGSRDPFALRRAVNSLSKGTAGSSSTPISIKSGFNIIIHPNSILI